MDVSIDTRALDGLTRDVQAGMRNGAIAAGDIAAERVRATFDAEGQRDGMDPWVPTTATALRARRNPPAAGSADWKTLIDTGALRASVTGQLVNDAPGFVEVEVAHRTSYGDVLDQGGSHDFGDGAKDIPARPFLDLVDPVDVDLLERAIDDALGGVL